MHSVNTQSFGLGALMLASAALGIYFDDLPIRIAAGALFLIGAVLLYLTLARAQEADTDDEVADASPDTERQAPKRRRERSAGTDADLRTQEDAAAPSPAPSLAGGDGTGIERPPVAESVPDIPVEYYRPESETLVPDDPREEFDFLTRKLLEVLRENLISDTVALFWINRERQQIVIGEFVTESRSFTTARRLPLGMDLVSKTGLGGRPVIITDINRASEAELLPYYDGHEGVQSFVGVPVYFDDEAIAVITADSRVTDSFGSESVAVIGKTAALVALMLRSYNQKFDLAADARLLGVLTRQRRTSTEHQDAYAAADAALQAVTEIMDWDYTAVLLYNTDRSSWQVIKSRAKTASLPYIAEGVTVDVEHGVLARALDEMKGVRVDAPTPPRFRFHEKEALPAGGELCVVPMIAAGRCLGLLVVEYREAHQYGDRDLVVLEQIAALGAQYVESARLQELSRHALLVDEHTGAASRTLLVQRLGEEIVRMDAGDYPAVFFLIALDQPDEALHRYGKHGLESIYANVVAVVRTHLAAYDVLGRFDLTRLGLLMIGTTAEDAYLRGEKIRKAVSGHVFALDGMTFSVTVSIAGCAFARGGDVDHVLRVAQQAMDRAIGDGGNCVKVV